MEIEEILGLTALILTMIVLISASISDWKEREVSDKHWIVLGAIGLVLFIAYSIHVTGFRWEYVCLAAGTALILLDLFWEREFNPFVFYFIMAVLFIVPLYGNMSEEIMIAWASIPICYVIFLGMYVFNIIRGGADVKCLIVLSIMFPLYPQFFGLPLISIPDTVVSQIFVSSIAILFLAAVMTVPLILYFIVRNVRKKDYSKSMFSSYMMDISEAETKDVWPLEDVVDGEVTHAKIPDENDIGEIYARLREAGRSEVRVTPMIPFIIMIAVSTLLIMTVGNPLFLIV